MRQARNLVQTGSFQRKKGKGAADSSAESNRHASSSEEEPPSPRAASRTSGADSRRSSASSAPSARSTVDSTDDEDSQGKKRPSNMEKFVDGAKKAGRAMNAAKHIKDATKAKVAAGLVPRFERLLVTGYATKIKPTITSDPQMPWPVRKLYQDTADLAWYEVQMKFLDSLRGDFMRDFDPKLKKLEEEELSAAALLRKNSTEPLAWADILDGLNKDELRRLCLRARAWFIYHHLPFDRHTKEASHTLCLPWVVSPPHTCCTCPHGFSLSCSLTHTHACHGVSWCINHHSPHGSGFSTEHHFAFAVR